jgi:hypothetical protein
MGVFVQTNQDSSRGKAYPIGYVIQESACWQWVGTVTGKGYGMIPVGGRLRRAHKHFYEQARGSVPAGLELDHLCRNRGCVNPDHLEAVTHQENILRSTRLITQCRNGHPYDEANTFFNSTSGARQCRTCSRAFKRRWAAENPTYQRLWSAQRRAKARSHA